MHAHAYCFAYFLFAWLRSRCLRAIVHGLLIYFIILTMWSLEWTRQLTSSTSQLRFLFTGNLDKSTFK